MKNVIQLVNGFQIGCFFRDIWDFSKLFEDLRDLGSIRNEEKMKQNRQQENKIHYFQCYKHILSPSALKHQLYIQLQFEQNVKLIMEFTK